MLLPEDALGALTQALRQDAAAGTLGRVRQVDLQLQAYMVHDRAGIQGVVDLCLDFGATGVPAAFERDLMYDRDGRFVVDGLALTFLVNDEHVSTVRALRDLGQLLD
jgi:hypothetical protein